MLVEVQEKIIAALTELGVFRLVDGWQGEIEELVKVVRNLPSAHVAYGEGDYDDGPAALGTDLVDKDMVWNVLITGANRRDRGTGAVECYQMIEATEKKLRKLDTGYGWLWPEKEKLLYAKNGLSIYGISFRIENRS